MLQSAANCTECGDALNLCYDADSAYDVCCPGCTETLTGFDSTTVGNFLGVCDIHPFVVILSLIKLFIILVLEQLLQLAS